MYIQTHIPVNMEAALEEVLLEDYRVIQIFVYLFAGGEKKRIVFVVYICDVCVKDRNKWAIVEN